MQCINELLLRRYLTKTLMILTVEIRSLDFGSHDFNDHELFVRLSIQVMTGIC